MSVEKAIVDTAAAEELKPEEKLALIRSHLQEVLKPEILERIVLQEKRPLVIYWGTATTGRPHCGYFVPMLKIAHFLRAGCVVKILLADIHGFLDNLKAPIELVHLRATYYRHVVTALLHAVGVSTSRLEFVLGSSYQLGARYAMDVFRLSALVTEHDAKKAGAEVVRQVEHATLSGLIYPLMQALDEEHLAVDAQFGGVDQRKIFTLAAEQLPKLGYGVRAHLMNAMVPGLAGGKMSSSDADSKIDILDAPDVVRRKVRKAFAVAREVEGNGMLSFVEYVLLPISALQNAGRPVFVVERRPDEGGKLTYTEIETVKADYRADVLTPQLLKAGVTEGLLALLAPIQADFQASSEWQAVEKQAYPAPEVKKKEKKAKDKGTRFPGAGTGAGAGVGVDASSASSRGTAEAAAVKDVETAAATLIERVEVTKKEVAES